MPGKNGANTAADDPLDVSDLVSEVKTVTISRNGEKIRLEGYVYKTAPVSVYAKIGQAHDTYMAVLEDPVARNIRRDAAKAEYFGRVARALIDGLAFDEADRLAGDFPRIERMLGALGYPPPRMETTEGEAPAAESTTESSSPSFEPSTAATTPTG